MDDKEIELTAAGRVIVRRLDKLAILIGSLIQVIEAVDSAMRADRRWQKRFIGIIALGAFFTAATGVFMIVTNAKIDATTRDTNAAVQEARNLNRTIEDCTNPAGECFKRNAEADRLAAEAQSRRSAALVQAAKDEIIARTEAELRTQLEALRRELRLRTSTITTTTRPRPTTTRPTTTTTQPPRPAPSIPPTTAPLNLLCSLLNIGC